jgi:hypothetical protein
MVARVSYWLSLAQEPPPHHMDQSSLNGQRRLQRSQPRRPPSASSLVEGPVTRVDPASRCNNYTDCLTEQDELHDVKFADAALQRYKITI